MPTWAAASCVLAILACAYPLIQRHRAEAANRAVGLAVEHQVLLDLATVSGVSEVQALRMARDAGVNGLVVSEETVGELEADGILEIRAARNAAEVSGPPGALNRLLQLGTARFGSAIRGGNPPVPSIRFEGSLAQLRTASLGLDPAVSAIARPEGFEIIARHSNTAGAGARYARELLRSSATLGAKWFLPSGDSVLGRRGSVGDAADALKAFEMHYVTPEFVKISGDDAMRTRLADSTLRLHSIQAAEADRMTEAAYVERFAKAYRERSIRWLLLRPISVGEENALQAFLATVKKTAGAVVKEGGVIKTPRPFYEPNVPRIVYPILFLLAAPFMAWVGAALLPVKNSLTVFGFIAGALAAGAYLEGARPYCALAAATAFPVGAYLWLEGQKAVRPWAAFMGMLVISTGGGLMVASTLIGVEWTLQNQQFTGIKLAHFLPIGLAALVVLRMRVDLREAAKQPILYGSALLAFCALGAVVFMLARTGNDNPAAVSGLELQARALLEALLYARPRTKEFLIGHPALIMGLSCLAWSGGRGRLAALGAFLCAAGSIGLTSVVNTLCHLHTPIELGAARIVTGLIIGGILGAFGTFLLSATLRRSWAED